MIDIEKVDSYLHKYHIFLALVMSFTSNKDSIEISNIPYKL